MISKSSWVVVCSLCVAASAHAQTSGVSDERVSLPGAPGSIGGVGENASTEGNQGAVQYRVGIDVPEGFTGLTPRLSLSYSSAAGTSVVGLGWSMPTFSIERQTSKGLQRYELEDRFVVDGASELIRVAESGGSATYRERFEGGFARYTWLNRGTGEAGTWRAEYADGRVGFFGADASDQPETAAQVRVPSTNKTFRWHLTRLQDRFGHAMTFTWTKDTSGYPLLQRIEYLFDGATPRYSVRLVYEARPDLLSDARPGFELRLTQRLKEVRVVAGTEAIRTYALTYEPELTSGGASRLARVARLGRGDVAHPVVHSFAYSRTLGGVCGADCAKPFVKDMGTLGASFGTGRATLLDINGDSLPDVLASTSSGVHTFYLAKLDAEGQVRFDPTAVPSRATVGSSAFVLGDARVQVLDVNGDGYTDIASAVTSSVLCNDGSGDWSVDAGCVSGSRSIPTAFTAEDSDATQQDPRNVRLFDYDNDRRIDWLRTSPGGGTTEVLANTPTGFVSLPVSSLGVAFDESTLQLADMNGDGLQDPTQLLVSGASVVVSYRLNLGLGNWGPTTDVTLSGLDPSQASAAELQDVNGDDLADVVAVVGNEVKLALNRNGQRFDAVQTITSASLVAGASLPTRVSGTLVSFADMNGNGSQDLVYFQPTGQVQYVELFPVRPNLLTRIENGLGDVQLMTYGTSIAERARDEVALRPWTTKAPNPMVLVTRMERFVTLTGSESGGLKEIVDYRYHDGFYDGLEKQFRGYAQVEQLLRSDRSRDAQEPGTIVRDFDVGQATPVLASEVLTERVYAGLDAGLALLREVRHAREACPVDGAPAEVRFACERATTTIHVERDPMNAVTTRTEQDFDGYGNVTRSRDLGVVSLGTPEAPRACAACVASGVFGAACGPMCLGDEEFTETDFIAPGTATGSAWIVGRASATRSSAVSGMPGSETRTFYDGPDFVGLAAGTLTRGSVTRVAVRFGPGATDFLDDERYKRDAHGNVAESLEPNASATDATQGRRVYTYDGTGFYVSSTEVRLGGTDVTALRRAYAYDTAFGVLSQASEWQALMGSTPVGAPQLTRYRYDEHGRLSRTVGPTDTDQAPGVAYTYELGNPASRVLITERSQASGVEDIASVRCFDGRGRLFQTKRRLSATSWFVDGFAEFDARGATVRRFQEYTSTTGACDVMPPADVPFESYTFDALARQLSETEADGAISRIEYLPLAQRLLDAEDGEASSPRKDTPKVRRMDGLGRLVALERTLEGTAAAAVTRLQYDTNGHLAVVRDAAGTLHTQTFDALGRLTRLEEPNRGVTTLEYDVAGNETRRTDGAGNVTRRAYDANNRLVAEWAEADEANTKRTWAYDRLASCAECTNAAGRLVRVAWPGGEERYGYDVDENPVFTQRVLGGKAFTVRRSFDAADREVRVTYPGGLSVDRTLDGAGRVTRIAGVVDAVTYTPRGNVAAIAFANGTRTAYTYDVRADLQSLTTTDKAGANLLQLSLTRLRTGKLQRTVDGEVGGRVRHGATYELDAWGRPKSVALATGDAAETLSYAFDATDNVLSATSSVAGSAANVGAFTYAAGRPSAVSGAKDVTYTYDGAGRLMKRGETTYTRDAWGRLVAAQGGEVDATFTWSPVGRVERKEGSSTTLRLDDDFEFRDGIGVLYVTLDDSLVVARRQSTSTAVQVLADVALEDGVVDVSDAVVASRAGQDPVPLLASAARRLLSREVTWLHSDTVDSLVAATDADGALVGERAFYPTGLVREARGFVDARGFTGQEAERSTGLIHFAERDLDPLIGRWDQPDPLYAQLTASSVVDDGEATTDYAYVGNAWNETIDPSGLKGSDTWVKGKTSGRAGVAKIGNTDARWMGRRVAMIRNKGRQGNGTQGHRIEQQQMAREKVGARNTSVMKDWLKSMPNKVSSKDLATAGYSGRHQDVRAPERRTEPDSRGLKLSETAGKLELGRSGVTPKPPSVARERKGNGRGLFPFSGGNMKKGAIGAAIGIAIVGIGVVGGMAALGVFGGGDGDASGGGETAQNFNTLFQ